MHLADRARLLIYRGGCEALISIKVHNSNASDLPRIRATAGRADDGGVDAVPFPTSHPGTVCDIPTETWIAGQTNRVLSHAPTVRLCLTFRALISAAVVGSVRVALKCQIAAMRRRSVKTADIRQ